MAPEPIASEASPQSRPVRISKWTVAWLVWGAIFLVVEGMALFNKEKGDTLSESLRRWGGIHTPERKGAQWAIFGALVLFFVWFPLHILTGKV